jgi:hypothetical protein
MVNTQIKWPHQPNAAILIYNQEKKTNAPRDFWIKTDDESRLKCGAYTKELYHQQRRLLGIYRLE